MAGYVEERGDHRVASLGSRRCREVAGVDFTAVELWRCGNGVLYHSRRTPVVHMFVYRLDVLDKPESKKIQEPAIGTRVFYSK